MKLIISDAAPPTSAADWVIAFLWEDDDSREFDRVMGTTVAQLVAALRKRGDVSGKANELTPILSGHGLSSPRLLLVGLGKQANAGRGQLVDAATAAARSISEKQRQQIAFMLPAKPGHLRWGDVVEGLAFGLMQGCYGPGLRKTEPARFMPTELICHSSNGARREETKALLHHAEIVGRATWLARELVNLPPSEIYPESFADRACNEAAAHNIEIQILDEKQLEKERMGALLAVARGSERPPRLVVLNYRKGADGRTLGLVGKGVTFDSGGLSLKSTEHMVDMKCDMAGAATVLAAIVAAAELQIPVNLLGVLALVENMPSGRAMKLGDVLKTRSGKTIEVLNTDAEGRLILADALTYTVDRGASRLVDLATLTGACMIALGTDVAGLMGNNDDWCRHVISAAERAGERVWQLPMYSHYGELIKSDVADMKNTGATRFGGAITAAKLLEQFVGDVPWAHLDIAGPAWAEHDGATHDSGGTGCFVRTLVELADEYSQPPKSA